MVFVILVMMIFMMAFAFAMIIVTLMVTIIVVILATCSALSRQGAGSVDVGASQGHGAIRQDTSD